MDLFLAGSGGYHTYRIPSLLVTPKGTVLAFCEGRRRGSGDSGDIDLLLRRSLDGGRTWGPVQVVWDDGENTIGNPCPVVDRSTGVIHLLLTRNLGTDTEAAIRRLAARGSREAWVLRSSDEGATWSAPTDITRSVKGTGWTWYATGPGVGIQLRSGRLLVPCDHAVAGTDALRSHVILSDDGGRTWRLGGVLPEGTNECQAAELPDGEVILNMRSYHDRNRRAVSRSSDGGVTWSPLTWDEALVEPVCQAALIGILGPDGTPGRRLLFSNPASTKRERMTVRLSEDGGRTWPRSLLLEPGPSAYSSLALLPDGRVACLYECGFTNPYARLRLETFDLGALVFDAGASGRSGER